MVIIFFAFCLNLSILANSLRASLFADKSRPMRHWLKTTFQFRGIPIVIGTEY